MATGDITFFDEAKAYMEDGSMATSDTIYCAVLDNTTTPAAADATPALADYTEVGAAGSYTAGGTNLGALSALISEAGGVMTFDSTTNPSWAKDALNDTDAWWGLLYNQTEAAKRAIGFVELGGPVDMSAGILTITWNASGIYTKT